MIRPCGSSAPSRITIFRRSTAGASAVVVPSLEEGFGLPAAEAMACGTAVVCSDRPALHEVVGDGALFFRPTDRDAIREALARILTRRRSASRPGSMAADRVARFAPDLVAERLLERTSGGGESAKSGRRDAHPPRLQGLSAGSRRYRAPLSGPWPPGRSLGATRSRSSSPRPMRDPRSRWRTEFGFGASHASAPFVRLRSRPVS